MLYYVYIISYTFFFSRTSQGVSRFHCYILCKIVFWRYLSPSSSHLFFFSLYAHVHMCIYFFFSFFFSDKCHLWFVYKVYVCIIHSYVFTCICTSFMFYTYTYIYMRVSACMCMCMRVCVCVDPCVRTRLIHLFIAYHLCRVVTNYTYIVQGFFFFFRPAVAPRVCVQRLHTSPKPKVYATRLPWDPAGRSPNSRKYISKILVFLT